MPNPTPQQRIEELARELEDGHRTYPDGTPRYEFMEKIRQSLKQAYLAGLEDVVQAWKDYDDVYGRDIEAHISQLKEQINQ